MRPRGFTVLTGAVVVVLLAVGLTYPQVPYVVLDPGPTVDTLGERDGVDVIEITGTETSSSAGELRLTTVGVQPDIGLLTAIQAWFDPEAAVVPRELVYPPGESEEEVERRNEQQFARSQSTAEVAALSHLGYPAQVVVAGVVEDAAASGRLSEGDVITSVDGARVESVGDLQERVTGPPVGTTLTVGYTRDGEPGTVEVTTAPDQQDGRTPRLGVAVEQRMEVPFELRIELDRIGGPSAGLMFALGIIDTLDPEDLTGGMVIAGTGSISQSGEVGPIGGLPQKLVAAREVGAAAFLVPADNCAQALRNQQPDLTMARVASLSDALAALAALRDGRQPPTC